MSRPGPRRSRRTMPPGTRSRVWRRTCAGNAFGSVESHPKSLPLRRIPKKRCPRLQMRLGDILVEGHAVSGAVAEKDVAVADRWLSVDEVCPPGDVMGVELDYQEVGNRSADVRRGHSADRAGDVMRCDVDVVGVRHVSH